MFFIDELHDMKLYRKKFLLPLNEKDKKKNSIAILLSPDIKSSISLMDHPIIEPKYYLSYYLERAVMYYINQESGLPRLEIDEEVVTESIEDVVEKESKFIYRGYSHDIDTLKKYANYSTMKALAHDYNVKIKYPITINIVGRTGKRENTAREIWLLSPTTYNSELKSYEMYVYYNLMELILLNANPKINQNYKYAMALHDSGLAELHYSNWIFGSRLKSLCKYLDTYEKKHGHKQLAKNITSNDFKDDVIKAGIGDELIKVAAKMLTREDTNLIYKFNDDGVVQLNESQVLGMPITEDASYNSQLKRILYQDRFKTLNDMKEHYEKVKQAVPYIKYTYNTLDRYASRNVFVDLSHYMYSYKKNATMQKERGFKIFNELLERLLNDNRYKECGYTEKSVIIPVPDWITDTDNKMWLINMDINPISCIYKMMKTNPAKLKQLYAGTTFIFISSKAYFKMDFGSVDITKAEQKFIRNIRILSDKNAIIPDEDDDARESSSRAITVDLVNKLEKSQGIEIDDISTDDNSSDKASVKTVDIITADKKKLVQTIAKAAQTSASVDDTMDDLDMDDNLKEILASLSANADNRSDISDARASRMIKLQDDLMDKQFKNQSIRQLTSKEYETMELKDMSLSIDTIDEDWNHLKAPTQNDIYDMDSDIVQIFSQFVDKTYPIVVRDIKTEDTSTGENAVLTYTVAYESAEGKRFSLKVDIPKWIDNKYLILGGNKKDIPNQLFPMPISKLDVDTVQIVSNYNKIFVRRFGTTTGKSFISCDKLIKTINKHKFKSLKVINGDNTKICNRYELPIDYVDLAGNFTKLITPSVTIYFNQDEIRKNYKVDEKLGIPIGVDKSGQVLYWNATVGKEKDFMSASAYIALLLETSSGLSQEGFKEAYESASRSIRYTYSRASILSSDIPLVLLCTYSEGLTNTLKKANIKYRIESTKRSMDPFFEDFIKFKDAFLIYKLDYASSLLLNGLKACPTSEYSIGEMDSRLMYLDFLDNFCGRSRSDGLDNFYNLLIDKPITYNTLKYYNLPTDYVEVLLYANRLLVDNKFIKHTNLTNNRRIRRHEQIPAILYSVLAKAYESYNSSMRHGRYVPMSVKQSAVCDEVLKNSTTSDKSIINALGEYEAYAAITPKGPSGMNNDRSYTLDKRSFDSSMLNVMGMSTGFAGNVGINRQMTIDANINSARGYIKDTPNNIDTISTTHTLCMTEALTPFGSTRDDPFRTAMTFVQTSKHGIRCKRSNPNLITTGADEALPYMISNIFAFKAKGPGTIKDINEDRMIVEYNDGTYDYVDLSTKVEKNSSSGFYVTLKLDTDLKVGEKVKTGDILAYDKDSFSSNIGATDNLAYNIGTFCKFAILNTDEGYEDSAIISEDLSDAMTSDIVLQIDKIFDKNTNIYNMVKKGQTIEEGDTLLIAQASYDEEDIKTLLRNLTADEEGDITDLGRIPIKSKVTGIVQDIKIYRTVELDELSPTLKKIVSAYEKDINAKKKEMKQYGIDNIESMMGSTGKLPATGRLKNADNGVLIEFYLKYEDRMSVGDKLIYYSANKGVVKDIFPKGKEPRSEFRPNEKIHTLISKGAIDGRMVCSIMIDGGINKGLVELGRKCKDILGIKYNDNLFES